MTPTKTTSNTKPAFHTPYKVTPPNQAGMSTSLAGSLTDKPASNTDKFTIKQPVFIPRTKIEIQESKNETNVGKGEYVKSNIKHVNEIKRLNNKTESDGKVVYNDGTQSESVDKQIVNSLIVDGTDKQNNNIKEKFEENIVTLESNEVSENEKNNVQKLNKTPVPENGHIDTLTTKSSDAMQTSDNEDDVAMDDDLADDLDLGDDLEDDSEEEKDVFYCRLVEARRQQGEIIERNRQKKTEPVRGRLYEQKQSGGRWKLREVIDRNIQVTVLMKNINSFINFMLFSKLK